MSNARKKEKEGEVLNERVKRKKIIEKGKR